jgi:hypothetical protein
LSFCVVFCRFVSQTPCRIFFETRPLLRVGSVELESTWSTVHHDLLLLLDIDRQAPALRRVVRSRSSTSANCAIVLLSDNRPRRGSRPRATSAARRTSRTPSGTVARGAGSDISVTVNAPSSTKRAHKRSRHRRQTRRRRRQQRRIGESAVGHAAQRSHVRRAALEPHRVPLVEKREPDAVWLDVHVLRCLARLAA